MSALPATLLPALLDLLPSGVVYYTPHYDDAGTVIDFAFAYLNGAAQQQLGLPAQPAVTYLQQWPGSVESGAFAFHRDTFLAGTPDKLEQFFQTDDYTFNIQAHARRVEEGLLVVFADIAKQPRLVVEETLRRSHAQARAARSQVEEALQESAKQQLAYQQLQRLFEQAPVAIFVLNGPTYLVEVVNPLMSGMLGHPVVALLGKPYFEVVPELATQGYPEYLAQVEQTRRPLTVQESPAHLTYHQPGESGYFTFVYQPLFDAADTLMGIMCVAVDVTAQVLARQQVQQLNQELRQTNTRLLRTNADLDSFVYTASHDLKTPIANIEGILHALRQELPAAQLAAPVTAHLLELMQHSIERFQITIGHLTNIMQLQHLHPDAAQEVDLATIVEGVQLDLAPSLAATHAQLQVELAHCVHMQFSPKNLRSILFNLLSNALKYRSPNRALVVQLRTSCTADHTTLLVADNGLGLTPEQQQQLFGLFRRFHTHVEGSGVGLYSIKKLIENTGGTITVQSELGVGTTFTVTLPR